jgi:hypothetical protein
MRAYEAPFADDLRRICEEIGYGRVIQLAEQWFEEKCPGWIAARNRVIVKGSDRHVCPHCRGKAGQ